MVSTEWSCDEKIAPSAEDICSLICRAIGLLLFRQVLWLFLALIRLDILPSPLLWLPIGVVRTQGLFVFVANFKVYGQNPLSPRFKHRLHDSCTLDLAENLNM